MKKILPLLLLQLIVSSLQAQWNTDTLVRNAICTAANLQNNSHICSDGAKGAIIVWVDYRVPNAAQVFAQRIDSNGVLKWASNGINVSNFPAGFAASRAYPEIDGSGGAIIAFEFSSPALETHIRAQRIDASGNLMWGSGVDIDNNGNSRIDFSTQVLAADGNGGVFVTWRHYFGVDVRLNHLDHNGNYLLGANGVLVSNGNSTRYDAKVISTGNNTAVVAYDESGILFAQRINALGNKTWGNTGVQLTSTLTGITYNNFYLQFTSSKNIIAAWEDTRASVSSIDIYAQKLDTNGVAKWNAAGVMVDNSSFQTINPEMTLDNHDGVFITYGYSKGFVQHIDSTGQLLWGVNGQSVGGLSADYNHHIGADGKNGIIVSWEEQRSGSIEQIYAQRFDSSGTQRWRPNGAPVATTGNGGVSCIPKLLSLNNGFAIAIWEDYRNGNSNQDIFAARLGNDAVLNLNFTATNTCFGDSTQFNDITTSTNSTVNFWHWNFGDASAIVTVKTPKHKYANTGNYNVTLTNMDDVWNYQSLTKQVVISPVPLVNIGKDSTICAGSSLLLNAGNPGLVYLWSTGATTQTITAVAAGTYWVQVTNGSCSSRDTMVLTVNPPIIVNLGKDTSICTGNSIQLNAANNGSTYLWSTGATTQTITASAAGAYWVQVTTGSCSSRDTLVLAVNSSVTVNLGNDTAICTGNSILLSAANNGSTYLWSTGATTQTITAATAGTYWVQVSSSGGCIGKDTIVLTTKPLPAAGFTFNTNNLAVTFNNTSANAITYSWLFGDGITSSVTSPAHTYSAAGTYPVKLLVTNTCKTDSVIQNLIVTSAITTADSCGTQFSVTLFPNPVHGILYIKFLTPNLASVIVSIINSLGQRVQTYEFNGIKCKDIKPIDMRGLSGGAYFFVIKSSNIKIVKKVLKQ